MNMLNAVIAGIFLVCVLMITRVSELNQELRIVKASQSNSVKHSELMSIIRNMNRFDDGDVSVSPTEITPPTTSVMQGSELN